MIASINLMAMLLLHHPSYSNADLGMRQRRIVPVTAEVMAGFRDRQYVYLPPEWEMNRVLQLAEPLPPSIHLPPLDFRTYPEPPLILWLPRGSGRIAFPGPGVRMRHQHGIQ